MSTITEKIFGVTKEGVTINQYTITNEQGASASVINYGGILTSLKVPDKDSILRDVVLGFDDIHNYELSSTYFGALIGRCGNRIANSQFTLGDKTYKLYANEGENHLHGGKIGYDSRYWDAQDVNGTLVLTLHSPDGEEGYPGTVDITVTYSLSEDNTLSLHYEAVTDQDTLVNLTNHSYFNLGGHNSGTILDHQIKLYADEYTPIDSSSLQTGAIDPVAGTALDFTELTRIGDRIDDDFDQLTYAGGYDHNFVLRKQDNQLTLAAQTYCESTGILMDTSTTLPGIQFYTANYVKSSDPVGKNGTCYDKRHGLCLETQFFPNAMEHKNFKSPILHSGEKFDHTTTYHFSIK